MKKAIVFGLGSVGSYAAKQLAKEHKVHVVDSSKDAIERVIGEQPKYAVDSRKASVADLSDPHNVAEELIATRCDTVVVALPEEFAYEAVRAAVKLGRNVVDISFWEQTEERLEELDALAKENNSTVFIDAGIAPGWSNGEAACLDHDLRGKTRELDIFVGSIPKDRKRGFFAAWSVPGIIEEYVRDALYVVNGEPKRMQAIPYIRVTEFQGVGELEAGMTDGLRTLPANLPHVNQMAEFCYRYPGHLSDMMNLRHLGYFDNTSRKVETTQITPQQLSFMLMQEKGVNPEEYKPLLSELGFMEDCATIPVYDGEIVPRNVAVEILAKAWKMRPDDRDILIMKVVANDGLTELSSELYAEHDGENSAVAVTTGGMGVLCAKLILDDRFNVPGMFPLEKFVQMNPNSMAYFTVGLCGLGVKYFQNERKMRGR
jgi:saccharopine dehydrogenase-like NADP-dependent oxidoreductase